MKYVVTDEMVRVYCAAVNEYLESLTKKQWLIERTDPVGSIERAARIGLTAVMESFAHTLGEPAALPSTENAERNDVYKGIVMRICQILEERGVRDIEDPSDALEILLRVRTKWNVKENPWYAAITDACVIDCIGWHDDDAEKTVRELIAWENTMALDPRVSPAAAELVSKRCGSVPDEIKVAPFVSPNREAYAAGWNACREAMLAAPHHPTTEKGCSHG